MQTSINDSKGELLFEVSVSGLAFVSGDGKWLRANPAICEMLQYTKVELEAKTFQEVTHPADVNSDVHMCDMVRMGQIPFYTMTKRYITKLGEVIWIKLRVDPVHDENGDFAFFLSQIIPVEAGGAHMAGAIIPTPPRGITLGGLGKWLTANWTWLAPTSALLGIVIYRFAIWWHYHGGGTP